MEVQITPFFVMNQTNCLSSRITAELGQPTGIISVLENQQYMWVSNKGKAMNKTKPEVTNM